MTTQQAVLNLEQILDLVGPLDDTPGENTPRERFRRYLATSVQTMGAVRDYIETCLRTSGTPYNRALQDLVNHTGRLIGWLMCNYRAPSDPAHTSVESAWA